ncbi:MAG: CPBP family intramembrane glutamic endopeptidase [Gemmatimonadales bacterium]
MTIPVPPRRQRPLLRALLGVVCFFLLGFLLFLLGFLPFANRLTVGIAPADLARHPTPEFALVQGLGLVAAFGASTWVVGWKAFHLDSRELRWRSRLGWAAGIGAGLVLGILPAAVAMTLGVFTAGASWVRDSGSLVDYAGGVGKTLLLLAPAALSEELMFRGLPLVLTARAFGRPAAIVLLSVLFALAHVDNPDVSVRALGNIALAGILLSLAFYSPGGMWTAFGAHLGWNGTLVALGAPVSGLPFQIPLVDYTMGGPSWLTGGSFGPEGGLLSTVAITATIVLAAQWIRKDPT